MCSAEIVYILYQSQLFMELAALFFCASLGNDKNGLGGVWRMDRTSKNYIKIALAGMFWGTLGFFGTTLRKYGLSSEVIAFFRLFAGMSILLIFFAIKDPAVLKINRKGLGQCALIGIISQGIFNLAYFTSMRIVGAFTSAVLLYASIIFLFIFGVAIYKEKPSRKKIIAVCVCMAGCVLGATGGDLSTLNTTFFGILMGLLAAFTYALMPVLNRRVTSTYNPFTIIIYSFFFAMLFLLPFAKPWIWMASNENPMAYLLILIFGFFASVIPYALYIPSLDGVQLSKVGVISSVELVVAILISGFVLKEDITIGHVIGGGLIFAAIFIMNTSIEIKSRKRKRS